MPVNGVIGRIEINTQTAADNRHPPFITTVPFPEEHPAIPVGTLLIKVNGGEPGSVEPAMGQEGEELIGVLNESADKNAGHGNMLIHGSCPVDILKVFNISTEAVSPVTTKQIAGLQAIGIYV